MTIKESVTVGEAINYLNSIMDADPLALRALLCTFIPCNQALADHPTAQISADWQEGFTVGLMGIINGLFGIDEKGWGAIAYFVSKENGLFKFDRTTDIAKRKKGTT